MKQRKDITNKERLSGVEAALRRAAQRNRELAAKTSMPLVIYSEGQIKKIWIRPKSATRPNE